MPEQNFVYLTFWQSGIEHFLQIINYALIPTEFKRSYIKR